MKVFQGPERIGERFLRDIFRVSGMVDNPEAGVVHRLGIFLIQLCETSVIPLFAAFYQFVEQYWFR
jgi:hypothetical protein